MLKAATIFEPRVVFLLFAIHSLACTAFNIQNCVGLHKDWVQSALQDTVFLATRAALTLEEELKSPKGISPEVQTILDAFLRPQNTQDIYKSILGMS